MHNKGQLRRHLKKEASVLHRTHRQSRALFCLPSPLWVSDAHLSVPPGFHTLELEEMLSGSLGGCGASVTKGNVDPLGRLHRDVSERHASLNGVVWFRTNRNHLWLVESTDVEPKDIGGYRRCRFAV